MKKNIIFCFFVISLNCYSQKVDTIIHQSVYTSYFNYKLREPLYVSYKLYKGGGACSRIGDVFKTGGLKYSATSNDYIGNGYDEGHYANAEDFAYDCVLQKNTFFFYNCVPQTPKLNRGCWKSLETQVRKESQTDSLYIICGGIFSNKKIGNIGVPEYCYKIVFSLTTKKVVHSRLFPNDDSDSFIDISLQSLIKKAAIPQWLLLKTN
jgi:DNA/RNA endonuclease G (NUC1)